MELFSPNSLNMSALGRQTLRKMSVPLPEEEKFPTGQEYYDHYLQPLGRYLEAAKECDIQLRCKVVSVARAGMLKGDMSKSSREKKFNIFCDITNSSGEVNMYHNQCQISLNGLCQDCRDCDARF